MSGFKWDDHPEAPAKAAQSSAPAKSGGFDWNKLPEMPANPSMGGTERAVRSVVGAVGPYVAPVAEALDSVTGAPVRSAIGAIQNKQNPAAAYMNQFGADPKQAPTGKEIAKKLGLSETAASEIAPFLYDEDGSGWKLRKGGMLDPTASGAAGLAIDAVADPLNVVGAGAALKVAGQGAKLGVKGAGQAVKGASIFADSVTGTKAATKAIDATANVAGGAVKIAENAKNSIDALLSPSIAKDFPKMKAVAQKYGITDEFISPAHEFGERSTITRGTRTLAEGATGEKLLNAHNAGMVKTSNALENNISVKFGYAPQNAADAGTVLKDAADSYVSKVFGDADITYSSAAKQFPGLTINKDAMNALRSKAVGMKREAMRLQRTTRDATQLGQSKNLQEWSDLILNSQGSYKEMSEIVQNVGKAAYAKTPIGQIPSDTKKLRELYKIGSESLIHSIRKVDQNAADRLIMNNADIAEMLGDKSMLGKVVSEAKNPEHIYNSLIKNGGSAQIETLKKIMPEQEWNKVRAKYLQDLIKYHPDESGVASINFKTTRAALERNKDKLSYLFPEGELQEMTELLHFGERFGNPVMSSSGTGASGGLRGFAKNLVGGSQDEAAIEYLKQKARGKANPQAPAAASQAPAAVPPVQPSRKLLRERGPFEKRLKVLQSGAPSTYKRPGETAEEEEKKKNMMRAKDSPDEVNAPKKGPGKWANDGIEKLREHGADAEQLKKLKETAAGRKILVAASDLKPGSKAMAKLMERLS